MVYLTGLLFLADTKWPSELFVVEVATCWPSGNILSIYLSRQQKHFSQKHTFQLCEKFLLFPIGKQLLLCPMHKKRRSVLAGYLEVTDLKVLFSKSVVEGFVVYFLW